MRYLILLLLCAGCSNIGYKNPLTNEEFTLTTFAKSVKEVQVVVASPDKVIVISVGETANDPILEQVADIIDSKTRGDKE
jgi:hypothetical protein